MRIFAALKSAATSSSKAIRDDGEMENGESKIVEGRRGQALPIDMSKGQALPIDILGIGRCPALARAVRFFLVFFMRGREGEKFSVFKVIAALCAGHQMGSPARPRRGGSQQCYAWRQSGHVQARRQR